MNISQILLQQLSLPLKSIDATILLLEQENTVPFIARYRKEATGYLDETQIRDIEKKYKYYTLLEERKKTILDSIEKQGKLSSELKQQIEQCLISTDLEDIYLPYKPKKRTRASMAKEKGLEPLADIIMNHTQPELFAKQYITDDVLTEKDALSGAMDIVAEQVAEDFEVRKFLKEFILQTGEISSKYIDSNSDQPEFIMYKDYTEPMRSIKHHRVLALNRGENKKVLNISMEWNDSLAIQNIANYFIIEANSYITRAIEDSYQRLLKPSLLREVKTLLTEKAEEQAISVFSKNLEQLLLQRPLKGCIILGIDPGIRTGSKYAIISPVGEVLAYGLLNQHNIDLTLKTLEALLKQHQVELIAIGNGTGSKEVEAIISTLLTNTHFQCQYAMVPETGASVYSASEVAKLEFPDLDVSLRGAISIARRLQDPLSEYVKIDPQSLGVGQYQHDVNQKTLKDELSTVVIDAVNKVGVNLNTASAELLKYVSGITSLMAKKIVLHRQMQGLFKTRDNLLTIKGFSAKTFEQAAGFLKIPQSENILDNTWIHPEQYPLATAIINSQNGNTKNINLTTEDINNLCKQFFTTKKQIDLLLEDLEKPNLDPRDNLDSAMLKSTITSLEDIQIGSIVKGTIRNIVDFGAFIDIGLKNDALVHISEICNEYIKHPLEKLKLGDILDVMVIDIDKKHQKIKISIKQVAQQQTKVSK